ncbi:MAG: hypothetical protein WHV28_09665 [Bacteroidota bacterium]
MNVFETSLGGRIVFRSAVLGAYRNVPRDFAVVVDDYVYVYWLPDSRVAEFCREKFLARFKDVPSEKRLSCLPFGISIERFRRHTEWLGLKINEVPFIALPEVPESEKGDINKLLSASNLGALRILVNVFLVAAFDIRYYRLLSPGRAVENVNEILNKILGIDNKEANNEKKD